MKFQTKGVRYRALRPFKLTQTVPLPGGCTFRNLEIAQGDVLVYDGQSHVGSDDPMGAARFRREADGETGYVMDWCTSYWGQVYADGYVEEYTEPPAGAPTAAPAPAAPSTPQTNTMTTVFETPLLVAEASKGNAKFWQGRVVTDGDPNDSSASFFTQTTSYQSTKDGGTSTPLVSVPKRIEPKNVGKANETTPRDQAIAEITSDEKKKRDKGYYDHGQAAPERLPLPMLAHAYKDRHRDMKWPCYVQPKLDGTRMLFDGKKGWSRQGKPYIPEVIEHLTVTLPYVDKRPLILDGELMLDHTQFSFQDTMTAIKKYRPDISPQLTYFIYDVLMEGVPFEERLRILEDITRPRSDEDLTRVLDFSGIGLDIRRVQIVMVPTFKAASFEEVKLWHERFIEAGFEGTMLRNAAGLYKVDHRSADLLKHKDFVDEEFLIVGVEQGVAKEEGCAIFVCQSHHATAAGAASIFNVRPKGTDAQRRELYAMREKLIGRRLKVKYQCLSDTGIPRFPVGLGVREDWDMNPEEASVSESD